jgi:predicted transcriptional regulator
VNLAGASVTKTATLLGISRATVSKVMSADTNHGKTTPAKRNSARKSTLTERDHRTLRRIFSKKHCNTGDSRTEYFEDPVSANRVRRELHNSNIHGRAVIAKPLIAESNAQMRK